VMEAFGQRPDLRVKPVKAIVGGPPALLRRLTPEALASQIDLLVIEDLPEAERSVRADADRPLPVTDIYFKYVDPLDLAVYFSAQSIWGYESQDEWWKREPSAGARALMAAELRSIRCHAILTDSEIIDLLGDETIEGHLPLAVRTELRRVARRAAAEGRPFTDTDLFASGGAAGTGRDLIDEMVESVPLTTLRDVVNQVIALLGLADSEVTQVTSPSATANDAGAIPIPVNRARSKPRSVPMPGVPLPPTKTAPPLGPTDRRVAGAGKSMPQVPPAVVDRTAVPKADLDGPPQPDDDFALFEEVSGRI
jgi:hypothetical protein